MTALAWSAAFLGQGDVALALTQPDDGVIPRGTGLQSLFSSRGEGIDALADAAITPETFVPRCTLNFEVVQRNASYRNSFGWYNVTDSEPELDDLHQVLACTDGVGTTRSVDIANDPGYLGGEVGFYQATGSCATIQNHDHIFYSQRQYNPDGNGSDVYIHLLVYNSTVTPRAFYFAWEDLLSGGDDDFDDLTTFVTGITCSGGGGPCSTGQLGVCAEGTLQCQSGQLGCVASNSASTEECDGLDNDCDGEVDNEAPCPGREVCDRGTCVPPCGGGDVFFPCASHEVCENDLCVDPDCIGVTCESGLRCQGGTCVEPCSGVTCPHGYVCRLGRCVDPCDTLTCESTQHCIHGVCAEACDCAGCADGETCQANGVCINTNCIDHTCADHEYCSTNGSCVDRCLDAVCPGGQQCVNGQCEVEPQLPGGESNGDAGAGADADVPPQGNDGGVGEGQDGDGARDASTTSNGGDELGGGCNCQSAGTNARAGGLLAILSILGLWL